MGRANIKQQFIRVIDESFSPGFKRHTAVDYQGERIVSFADRDALLDTASDFAKFCKANGIKKLIDIKPKHVSKWLQQKADNGCSEATLKTYRSRMVKIGKMIREVHGFSVKMRVPIPQIKPRQDSKIRCLAMTRQDLEKAIDNMKPNSQSRLAIEIGAAFGLRVSETVKIKAEHIDLRNNVLHIVGGKGGRDRDIEIRTEEQRTALERLLKRDDGKGGYLLTIKEDSVNRSLSRNLEKAGITRYREGKTGLHSVRKMYATERYNKLREQGLSHKDAWGEVSSELGHGRDREDLYRVYVVK